MRKLTIRLFFCFLCSLTFENVCAQESNSKQVAGSDVTAATQAPVDRLQLRADQQIPYREIIKRYAMVMKEVRKSALPKEEKTRKLEILELEKEAEIKAVLSPEQFKVYLERKEENKSKYIDMRKK
jgi:hypothetical protein